ncbi:MAG: PIN domain-containing protein [archaeon]
MKLIVDTNRIIAALIKDSYCRRIILSEKIELFTLGFGVSEVKKYTNYILKKTKLQETEFNELMNTLLAKMTVFEETDISKKNYFKAKEIMEKIDENDVPFIALALEIENDGIWSDDKHFTEQKKVKVWPTKTLVKKF